MIYLNQESRLGMGIKSKKNNSLAHDIRSNSWNLLNSNVFVFSFFLVTTICLQWAAGACSSEYGRQPDEAAHFITGLMVRDFLFSLDWLHPYNFAENYYLHYPKVAIGHWPPFFYLVEGLWILLFTPYRLSILLLTTLLTTLLALTLYSVSKAEFGRLISVSTGFLFILLPKVQEYTGLVMLEIPTALFGFWSVLYFGKYLDSEKSRDAIMFGLFASMTILTKPIGIALGLIPPIALILTGRYKLLMNLSFWLPAFIVIILCGPWYWYSLNMATKGMIEEPLNLLYSLPTLFTYTRGLISIMGIGLLIVIAIGVGSVILKRTGSSRSMGIWIANGAFLIGLFGFLCVVTHQVPNSRYLCSALPSLFVFLAAGIGCISDRIQFRQFSVLGIKSLVISIIVIGFMCEVFRVPQETFSGFKTAIKETLLSDPSLQNSIFLISSDSKGEGAFISEVATQEDRPGHVVLRSSKFLSTSNWNGDLYKSLYETSEEIAHVLESVPVGIVAIDMSVPSEKMMKSDILLKKTMESNPEKWKNIGTFPVVRRTTTYNEGLTFYRFIGHKKLNTSPVRINMNTSLNRTLTLPSEYHYSIH